MILGIDPGLDCGWAVLDENGLLRSCGLGVPPTLLRYDLVVVERPQIYPNTPAKQANDLITLAIGVGRLAERYAVSKVQMVLPREWKGSVPKPVNCARILNALGSDEIALLPRCAASKKHNIIDAIGIAKWAYKASFLRVCLP